MLSLVVMLALAQPAEPQVFALSDAPLVAWADDDVLLHAGLTLGGLPVQPLVGEVLGVNQTLVVPEAERLVLLVAGERLVTLKGPGTWRLVPGGLETAFGAAPTAEAVVYREGPLALAEPVASWPGASGALDATLAWLDPRSPLTLAAPTDVRWRWPYDGAHFDLAIARSDTGEVVERWKNIEGRAHKLWTALVSGVGYRATIALASEDEESAIVDVREFRVASVAEAQSLDAVARGLDRLMGGRYRPELDVLKARVWESHGLWAEAEALWTGLAVLFPSRPELYYRALRLHRQR